MLIGTEAVSRFFVVGRLEAGGADALDADKSALRGELLADPLLQAVPSMKPEAGKTALIFHAKNDVPEVRHAGFKLLMQHDSRMSAVVKEKHHLLADVRGHEVANPSYRCKAVGRKFYDALIARLFGRFGEFGVERHVAFAVRAASP